ncbi:GTPase HflX [Caldithrix abyssi]|uniref:GTPase HflX n=1 Tax=Caldithrix abyssi TaxID=187145 RepID=UPI001CEC9AD2|nr:GTPase HflX [Caldithrix abyssi]
MRTDKQPERCVLVGVIQRGQSRWEVEDHLSELAALARTSGADIIDTFIQERPSPDPAYFIGKGKIEEIAEYVSFNDIDLLIFDDELSPAQVRNIENLTGIKVIDRTALILDIFALHARTNMAKVQVELAQLNYYLPRLTRQWQHLSRQVGGIGTKGPGETQLETDRRLVRQRISHLKEKLEKIAHQNEVQRQQRQELFRAALIGYTNAGKSTLMNALTNARVLIEDQLFATLDTTVRRLALNPTTTILLSDTVGFIRKLPHHLVASFQTTLAEAIEADLLIHVVDVTHPHFEAQVKTVNQILDELHLNEKKRLLVFNKVDRLKNHHLIDQLRLLHPEALFISAARHIGLQHLRNRLLNLAEERYEIEQIRLNYQRGAAEHLIYPLAKILEKSSDEQYLYLTIKYDKANKSKINQITAKYR